MSSKRFCTGLVLAVATALGTATAQAQTTRPRAQTPLSEKGQSEFSRILSPQAEMLNKMMAAEMSISLSGPVDHLQRWNDFALLITAQDHARGPGQGYDNLGPHRSSRAMAIVHIAIYDAVNSIKKKYQSYSGIPDVSGDASVDAAIAQAAHDTLVKLFPLQKDVVENFYNVDVAQIAGTDAAKKDGFATGKAAADAIIHARVESDDGSSKPEPDVVDDPQQVTDPAKFVYIKPDIGVWQPDPVSKIRVVLGYHWGEVKPFVLSSADQFRPDAPPAISSPEYAELYNETKRLGGDSTKGTATDRKPIDTFRGIFWAYDGTPGLCAPPRFYNQIAKQVREQNSHTLVPLADISDRARYLALLNTAMADAAISAWEAKWHYKYWRPVTAIRYAGDDGNPATEPDASFYPLGSPATNSRGPNFTPPFPTYPSGHAVFGGAVFEMMRKFFGNNTSVQIESDEFDGINHGMGDEPVRPAQPLSYSRLSDAEWENGRSRIWLGIHWQIDADAGVKEGNAIADYVYDHAFKPR